jgi:hypothetical protein
MAIPSHTLLSTVQKMFCKWSMARFIRLFTGWRIVGGFLRFGVRLKITGALGITV